MKSFGPTSIIGIVLIAAAIFFGMGFFTHAQAASPAMDNSCRKLNDYGFTQGLVYCVQASIGIAVNQYTAVMQHKMLPYALMAMIVAIALFGLKLQNSHVQEPKKEVAKLAFRIIIGLFFYYESGTLYNAIAGTFPKYDGIMNQAVGWVTGFSSGGVAGSGNNIFGNIVSANCIKVQPPHEYEGFQIWQAFDCMFSKVFGAANPATHPYAFFTSLLVIVGAALLSATLGIIVAGIGISMLLGLLLFICRALYLVLTAYICVGFIAIFMPVFAPLFFFESQFLTQKFKQSIGVVISCIFQAIFVVGFLGLAVSIDDLLIEGDLPGCTPPTYPVMGSLLSNAPPEGYGQNGKGVCSVKQLVDNGKKNADLQKWYHDFMEPNATAFEMSIGGDPQGRRRYDPANPSSAIFYNTVTDPQTGLNVAKTSVIPQAHPLLTNNANLGLTGLTILNKIFPMKQLILIMLTFIFVNTAIKELMEILPAMAANMTIATGINLAQQMQLPLEGAAHDFLSGANDAAMKTAKGQRGPAAMGRAMLAGVRGGVGSMFSR